MNPQQGLLPVERFLRTLDVVRREGEHLAYSWRGLHSETVDAAWIRSLAEAPERAERLDAYVSRFGRMQDIMADKLLPQWLDALAERPGSQIDNLNRAERLGVVSSVQEWLEARKLCNRLVHEYQEDPVAFADSLKLARGYALMFMATYNKFREYALQRMGLDQVALPPRLELPDRLTNHDPRL